MTDAEGPMEATFARCPSCDAHLWLHHLEWVKAKDGEIARLREVEAAARELADRLDKASVGFSEFTEQRINDLRAALARRTG